MGGRGSGQYYRFQKKPTVEEGLVLDLSRLIRNGNVMPGGDWQGTLYWSNVRTGERTASIGYKAYMSDPDHASIQLNYNWRDEPQNYSVKLTTTKPNYGGLRWWFLCPITDRRVAKLYTSPGQPLFASREALGLSYQSQRECEAGRKLDRAYELRRKLGRRGSIEEPLPTRPKGMHHKTYFRICADITRLEEEGWSQSILALAGIPYRR